MKSNAIYTFRRVRNWLFIGGSAFAALFGILWLAAILGYLIAEGVPGVNLDLFTLEEAPPPGEGGGLANHMVGSLILIGIAVVIGTPIGILGGTYLAEYGKHHRFAAGVRILNDILLSAPSIVVGLFVYGLVVVPMGHFSAIAGSIALAVIVIPVVLRTTENMLHLIPDSQREAARALGAPAAFVIRKVLWKSALAGIVTGVLLATARISGETAPLLFTAFGNHNWSFDLNAPFSSMPIAIYNFANSAYDAEHKLAWAGALVITVAVLALSILARLLAGGEKK
jgi:phosphate transport system permease protein